MYSLLKLCRKCGETKSLSSFSKSKTTKDRLHTQCTRCKNLGRNHTEMSRKYRERHRDRHRARCEVWREIGRGVIPKAKELACVDCGLPAKRYDHYRGYEREHWLDVQPVCITCCTTRELSRRRA